MKLLLCMVFSVLSATALAVTPEDLTNKVEQYYLFESQGDYQAITQLFQPGGEVSYALDFGMLMPTYDVTFKVVDASSFDVLLDEEDDSQISNIQWGISVADVNGQRGKVVVNLKWDYKSSDGDGSVTSTDTFDFVIQDQQILIRSYQSEQQY